MYYANVQLVEFKEKNLFHLIFNFCGEGNVKYNERTGILLVTSTENRYLFLCTKWSKRVEQFRFN